jgi:hypothetical protein
VEQSGAGWEEKFKAQIEREDAAEGRAGHRDRVDAAMRKLMEEITKGTEEHAKHSGGDGAFGGMSMMQQMDRSFFLGPTGASETVTSGGACPRVPWSRITTSRRSTWRSR